MENVITFNLHYKNKKTTMENRIIKTSLFCIAFLMLLSTILFFIGAFYSTDLNPKNWHIDTRGWVAFGMFLSLCISLPLSISVTDPDNQK